jgi:hypothetical protein
MDDPIVAPGPGQYKRRRSIETPQKNSIGEKNTAFFAPDTEDTPSVTPRCPSLHQQTRHEQQHHERYERYPSRSRQGDDILLYDHSALPRSSLQHHYSTTTTGFECTSNSRAQHDRQRIHKLHNSSFHPVTPDTNTSQSFTPVELSNVVFVTKEDSAYTASCDTSTMEDLSSVSSFEHNPHRDLRLSMDSVTTATTSSTTNASDCQQRRRFTKGSSSDKKASPTAVDDLSFDFDHQHKNPEAKRLNHNKKRSTKSALAKRLASSQTAPRKARQVKSSLHKGPSSLKVDGVRSTTFQIILALSFTFILLLLCILSALSNISKEIGESSSRSPLRPQVKVADMVDKRFKMLEKRFSETTVYMQPTMLDALSHKKDNELEATRRRTKPAPSNDYDPTAMAALLGTDKPPSDTTFQDLHFQRKTNSAPSCTASLREEDIAFTLVTQVSEDRLWMLTQHCHRWQGPISVAVFTDLPASQITKAITQESSVYGKCNVGQVMIQTFSKTRFTAEDYPVNALRNMALRGVTTSHFFYADIDFWASDDLLDSLQTDFMKQQLASDPKLALVIPAFQMSRVCKEERDCRPENMHKMPYSKQALVDLVRQHKASAFDPTNHGGHGSTSYSEWFNMAHGDLWDIPCILSNRYEPYIAVRYCADFPPYQEVFTGYGKNKMTQIMQMRRSGYLFSQVGGAFVVHYPHLSSATRNAWNHGKKKHDDLKEEELEGGEVDWTQFKRGQVDKIFAEFRHWLDADVEDLSRVPMCPDALNDDEKLWI